MFYDIFDEIEDECSEGLRSMRYDWEIENIVFDDSYANGDVVGLEYVGNYQNDKTLSNGMILSIDDIRVSDSNFNIYNNISDNIEVTIAITDLDNNEVEAATSFNSEDTLNIDSVLMDWDLPEQIFDEVKKYISNVYADLSKTFDAFEDDVISLSKAYSKILSFKEKEFKTYIETFDHKYVFDEDGNVKNIIY